MLETTPSGAADTRNRVLDAAERIVHARGVAALTLDAAAREAGVSKGGLLYHFATKEALLAALMQRLAAFIRADFEATRERVPPGPGRTARAVLAWHFGGCSMGDERLDRATAVFLATFHHDPALLDPVRAVLAEIRAAAEAEGLPPGHGLAVLLACDGLFMAHMFRLWQPDEAQKAALQQVLTGLVEAGRCDA
ncbi:MAG: TetR/AcrR family transcriptional regulator [Rhodovarius sp.]|nr:TetR/AcrR family transcriptional regulator [Rhodovarius sp.]MCX7931976.1 TetR/AcrR family transcriptional regulator [Rhodovarius sp.]MDW8313938.1 TetR/AcrR family transcriptional regulator [Rhodovarius sp.]